MIELKSKLLKINLSSLQNIRESIELIKTIPEKYITKVDEFRSYITLDDVCLILNTTDKFPLNKVDFTHKEGKLTILSNEFSGCLSLFSDNLYHFIQTHCLSS